MDFLQLRGYILHIYKTINLNIKKLYYKQWQIVSRHITFFLPLVLQSGRICNARPPASGTALPGLIILMTKMLIIHVKLTKDKNSQVFGNKMNKDTHLYKLQQHIVYELLSHLETGTLNAIQHRQCQN